LGSFLVPGTKDGVAAHREIDSDGVGEKGTWRSCGNSTGAQILSTSCLDGSDDSSSNVDHEDHHENGSDTSDIFQHFHTIGFKRGNAPFRS
jgi:hypothetical protein